MPTPLRVTFDTNTYSVVGRPQIRRLFSKFWPPRRQWFRSAQDRLSRWYLNWCIRRGRIVASIPEGVLKAEVVAKVGRVALLQAIGTPAAAIPPPIDPTRDAIIQEAFKSGFRVLRSPRIAWGAAYPVRPEQWMMDIVYSQSDRQARESKFVRHFKNYPFETIQDYGVQLLAAHGLGTKRILWRDGLAAEEAKQLLEPSAEAFQRKLRNLMADWADFDVVAVHYAYGFDILCTEDRGSAATSILSPTRAPMVQGTFGVRVMNVRELTSLCLQRFGFPLKKWN